VIVNEISNIFETGAVAFEQDDDLDMVEKSIPGNIKLLEAVLENDPQNHKILIMLSKLYAAYSFGFFEDRLESSARGKNISSVPEYDLIKVNVSRYYSRGIDYALRALEARDPGVAGRLMKPESADSVLKRMKREDVPGLFWYGFNLSSLINNNRDSVSLLAKAYLVEKIMKRVLELDPEYFFGGSHLILLSYYSSMPPYSDEKYSLSLFHYRKLKELNGGRFILADLYFARYCLTVKQEKEKFINIMREIVTYSGGKKECAFYNRIAYQRAKRYLDEIDHYFE
jgi:hypothetical protein